MASATLLPDEMRRVAVLRALRGLGDMLCAVPALRALRTALPDAEVTLVGLPSAAEFARRFSAYVDVFAPVSGFPAIHDGEGCVEELPAFLADMHARRFDLALQMHGSGLVSNPLAALLGARRLGGFYLPGQWLPDPDLFAPYPADLPEPRRWLALTAHLGMPAADERLEFPLAEDDRAGAAALAEAHDLARGRYAIVHPGAEDPRRRWPTERFAIVADTLALRGFTVVLTGTEEERPMVEAVALGMSSAPVALAGRTNLGALAALVDGARLVVSNDTGTSHLADALRKPSVVMYTGASNHQRWAPIDDRLHRRCGPPASGTGGCGLPVNERCLRDGCTVTDHAFEPYFAPTSEVLGQIDELLAEEAAHVA